MFSLAERHQFYSGITAKSVKLLAAQQIIAEKCSLHRLEPFRQSILILFLSVMMAACTPSAASGVPTVTAPSVQVASSLTPTMYIMPTPPPTALPICPGAPKERLILQERGWVLPDDPRPVNMRSEAGVTSTLIMQIPIRAVFYVLDGPVCNGDFAWYKVRYQGREGWIAEGDLTSYYVEPYLPG